MAGILKALLLLLSFFVVTIDAQEVRPLHMHGKGCMTGECEAIMKAYDTDLDGRISLEELHVDGFGPHGPDDKPELGRGFKLGDTNGDGYISLDEVPGFEEALSDEEL